MNDRGYFCPSQRCDDKYDCWDGRDEQNCYEVITDKKPGNFFFN